ncbi:hypothetical protein PM082_023444 [Marasmius tenuissimus]|nr:hypothetical protein PM082_023444 [Marasmius tenuissimus]
MTEKVFVSQLLFHSQANLDIVDQYQSRTRQPPQIVPKRKQYATPLGEFPSTIASAHRHLELSAAAA